MGLKLFVGEIRGEGKTSWKLVAMCLDKKGCFVYVEYYSSKQVIFT